MELSNLNTPAELIAANQQPEPKLPASAIKEQLFNLNAPEALDILKECVAQMACWHQSRAAEADSPAEAAAWACDEGRLHCALLALNEVAF